MHLIDLHLFAKSIIILIKRINYLWLIIFGAHTRFPSLRAFCILRAEQQMFPNELEEEWGCEREEEREREREFLAVKLERGAVRTFELLSEYYSYFIRRGRWE